MTAREKIFEFLLMMEDVDKIKESLLAASEGPAVTLYEGEEGTVIIKKERTGDGKRTVSGELRTPAGVKRLSFEAVKESLAAMYLSCDGGAGLEALKMAVFDLGREVILPVTGNACLILTPGDDGTVMMEFLNAEAREGED